MNRSENELQESKVNYLCLSKKTQATKVFQTSVFCDFQSWALNMFFLYKYVAFLSTFTPAPNTPPHPKKNSRKFPSNVTKCLYTTQASIHDGRSEILCRVYIWQLLHQTKIFINHLLHYFALLKF